MSTSAARSFRAGIALISLLLGACDQGVTDDERKLGSALPSAIRTSTLPATCPLEGFVQIDGGALHNLSVSNGMATARIPNPPMKDSVISILFRCPTTAFGVVNLATGEKTTTLVNGRNTVDFTDQDYQFPDDDSDGASNLAEITAGTDPTSREAVPEQVVFVRQLVVDENTMSAPALFKMNADGGALIGLANPDHIDTHPDVRHDGQRIVFDSVDLSDPSFTGFLTMNVNGSDITEIRVNPADPAVPTSIEFPKWSRADPYFIVYVDRTQITSAIWLTQPDGSGVTQITMPGARELDLSADVVDSTHIVFERSINSNINDRDLFIKSIGDTTPPVRLTDTPNVMEEQPVVSHSGLLLAYFATTSEQLAAGTPGEIRVATFDVVGNLNVQHVIALVPPVSGLSVFGLDFSSDDQALYFSTFTNDLPGTVPGRHEVFRMNLDGSNQVRLTMNTDLDVFPSVVPATGSFAVTGAAR
ncbi:MAG: hypothetical protein ACR2RB_08645 [Gammaproteobacteria bacterium]